jgi:hypothetical protein
LEDHNGQTCQTRHGDPPRPRSRSLFWSICRGDRLQEKRLRKGRGTLVTRIDEIVEELVEAGTVKANAQPVVIVVREKLALPWPFANVDLDEDEDDEDDEDEDEDEDWPVHPHPPKLS